MVEKLVRRLIKKGWKKEHIHKAVKSIIKAKENKHQGIKFMDSFVYWIILCLIAVGNFAISISLLPLLLGLKGIFLYGVVAVTALAFGLLFEIVIRSMEHLEAKHHIFLSLVIPITASINLFIMAQFAKEAQASLGIGAAHNNVLLSVVYAAAFVLPYAYYKLVLKKGYYSEELSY